MYQWLKDYYQLQEEIDYMELKLNKSKIELERWCDSGDLGKYKLDKHSHGAKLEEIIEDLEWNLAIKLNHRHDVLKFINTFKDIDQRILKLRYIEGMTLEQMEAVLPYSFGYIAQKHAELKKRVKWLDSL